MHSVSQSNLKDYKEKLVCRTCLKIVHGTSFKIQDKCETNGEDGTTIAQVLRFIVPELYLGLSASPEICYECKESVRIAYSFRKQCLHTENLIGSYLKVARCNTRVIDLYSVLEYSRNTEQRAHHDVQKIISDWEDDSSEDNSSDLTNKPSTEISNRSNVPLDVKKCFVPTCSNTDANSSKIFINVPHQEDISKNWCSAAGITKIPTTKSSYVFCCEDHFNLQEDCENWMEYKMRNVKMRMKKHARPHLNLQGDYMRTFEKYHSQLSPTSRKRRMENIELDKMNTSNFVKEVPSTRSVDRIPQTIVIAPNKFTKIQLPSVASNHTTVSEIKKQQKTHTKILFRNNNEELCIIELNEEKSAVEMEKGVVESKKKAEPVKQTEPVIQKENEPTDIIKEPQLNVCEETGLYKNKEGEYFNAALEAMNVNEVNDERKKARIRGENLFEISDTCSVSENFICEETGLFKNSKGEYFTECGKSVDLQEVEAEKVKAKIRGENLFQITNICTVPEEAVEKLEEVPDKTISSLAISAQPSPLEKLQELVSSNEAINYCDKSLNNREVHEGLIDIKEEPLEMNIEEGRVEFNYVPKDDEETLTASESASYENLEGLLDSLDTNETSQYVDIPEFVQINHFTMKDLENLKKQQQILHDETQKDLFSLQNPFTSFPYGEQIIENDLNLKMLLAEHSSLNPQVNLNQNMPEKVAFGGDFFGQNEERYKLDKMTNRFTILPLPDSPKGNIIDYLNRPSSEKYPKMTIPPIVKKAARKPRRRRVKIVAVSENETGIGKNSNANTSHPNREICVLFTNYSFDGLYINDHDYLVTPYKRNKILWKENGQSFCMCFICGYKHRLDEHVMHMNLHNPKCRICNVNLGTGYMLNLHVKSHTRPCRVCTDLVPYSEISVHEKKHRDKELEFIENDKGRKRKKKDEDYKPAYYHISKLPRSSRSRSQVPSNEVDGVQVKFVNENNVEIDKTDVNNRDTENVGMNNVEENKVETNNVEENEVETNNVEENEVETNNVEENKLETNNVEKNKVETNNVEKNKVETNNVEENKERNNVEENKLETNNVGEYKVETNNVEKNIVEANDLEANSSKTNYNDTIEAEANSFIKISSECSETEENKAEANSSITNNTDAKNIETIENKSIKPKKFYSKRKRSSRKTEMLSKEECDLEEKLLKICEKSKNHADKRILRSSFVTKSSECSEMEERQEGSAKHDIRGNKCSYFNCELSKRIDPTLRMFGFPVNDTARCQKWIIHSGNAALADFSPKLLKKKCICSKHFLEQKHESRNLPSDAVPFHYSTCNGSVGAESTDKDNFEAPPFR